MKKEDYLYQLKLMGEIIIDVTDSMIKYAEVHHLTNEPEFLDIVDELNRLSVKY